MACFIADVDHCDYPDLVVRMELAMRASIAVTFEMEPADRGEDSQRGIAEAARLHARIVSNKDNKFNEGFRALLARVQRDVKNQDKDHRLSLSRLRDHSHAQLCSACTAGPDICRHSLIKDPQILATGRKLCLQFLVETFQKLVKHAERFYNGVMDDTGNLKAKILAEQISEDRLTAETHYPAEDQVGNRRVEIRVKLPLDHLDDVQLSALPYVLFHEIFVHGPESWSTDAVRTPTPEICAFREGFVDAAGAHVLKDGLHKGVLDFAFFPGLNTHLALRTERAQTVRASFRASAASATSRMDDAAARIALRREYGMKVFKRFEQSERRALASRLAAAINLVEADLDHRRLYLKALDCAAKTFLSSKFNRRSAEGQFALRLEQLAMGDLGEGEEESAFIDLIKLQHLLHAHLGIATDSKVGLGDLDF